MKHFIRTVPACTPILPMFWVLGPPDALSQTETEYRKVPSGSPVGPMGPVLERRPTI